MEYRHFAATPFCSFGGSSVPGLTQPIALGVDGGKATSISPDATGDLAPEEARSCPTVQSVAERLSQLVAKRDHLPRIGGDEFAPVMSFATADETVWPSGANPLLARSGLHEV
jgi:hypothetical protein